MLHIPRHTSHVTRHTSHVSGLLRLKKVSTRGTELEYVFAGGQRTVVWALERFAEYTQGYHVIVECDHQVMLVVVVEAAVVVVVVEEEKQEHM
jgi:hypothetical protein